MVNVPTSVLIDENGTVVRFDEGAYSRKYELGNLSFGTDAYLPMVKDWLVHGAESQFVREPDQLSLLVARRTDAQARADAAFRLGTYFELTGDRDRAELYWQQAQELNPDSWNYHRQEWSYAPAQAGAKWFAKFQELDGKPYYEPLALPAGAEDSQPEQ